MKRRTGWMMGLTALTLAVAGCGSSGEGSGDETPSGSAGATKKGDPVRIAYFNPLAANPVTAANFAGVEDEARKWGAKVNAFDAAYDQAKQVSQIQDAIAARQYDAFVIMPVNGAALVDVAKQAIDAGIVVVADWNNIGPDPASLESQTPGLASVVGQSLSDQGTRIGEEIVRGCEDIDPCNAVYMPGSFNQGSEKLRMDEVTKVTDQHSNIKMKISADGGYQNAPAQAAATDVLLAIGDVHVFATPGDQMALGIVQAVEDANKSGEVKIISAGTSEKTVQLVRDGVLFSDIVTLPYSEGVYSTRYAIQAVNGEEVPEVLDSITLSPMGPVATKETLSTPEGLKFKGEFPG